MKWKIAVLTLGLAAGAQAGILFSDGFESGDFTTGGWTVEKAPVVRTGGQVSGSYCAQIAWAHVLTKSLDLSGKTGVTLSYAINCDPLLETNEFIAVEASADGGANWVTLEEARNNGYATREWSIAPEMLTSGFAFRFVGPGVGRWCRIDDVLVTDDSVASPPVFMSDPVVEAAAEDSVAYSGTLADNALDPDGDPMTFSLVSPTNTWLAVAEDGTLSGTPDPADAGLNSWTVQVSDGTFSNTATLNINVAYGGERVTLFSDGFESGDHTTGGWTIEAGQARFSSAAASGSNCVNLVWGDKWRKDLDLEGMTKVTLSYAINCSPDLPEANSIALEVSADGGATWVTLEELKGTAGYVAREWSLAPEMFTSGFAFRFDQIGFPGSGEWCRIDDVLVTAAAPEGGVYAAFDAVADPVNLIANPQFNLLDSQLPDTEQTTYNVLGSFGDAQWFTNKTANITGWAHYYADPNGLTAAVGTPHVIDGVGELDSTFYLDTHVNATEVTLNSSMDYRNGMKQEDILAGTSINPAATYALSIDAWQRPSGTVQDNATFRFALTAGADATNMANAVAGSLLQTAATNLLKVAGTPQVLSVSGAALATAQSGGPVNVIFDHINPIAIPGFPGGVAAGDVNNNNLVSQLKIGEVSLLLVIPENDLNKDGVFDQADVDLAQLYLDGAGGDSAADRQAAWIALGKTPTEALAQLNLTDFDIDGDGTFDLADVAALWGPQDVVVQAVMNGSGMEFVWPSNVGKTYDLESCTSLVISNWAVYNDGVTTYENMASTLPTNSLIGVQDDGQPVRFFRIIEK